MVASLFTEGLHLRASNIHVIARSLSVVDFASLVFVACVICELQACRVCPVQRKHGMVDIKIGVTTLFL